MFQRGYDKVRQKMEKPNRYIMSCENCQSFSQEKGDTEEVCQNMNVSEYDLVFTDKTMYCSYWKPYSSSKEHVEMTDDEKLELLKRKYVRR